MIFQRPSYSKNIEGFGQVKVGREQVGIMFLTFLLQLPCSKHHVDGPALFTETTLAGW